MRALIPIIFTGLCLGQICNGQISVDNSQSIEVIDIDKNDADAGNIQINNSAGVKRIEVAGGASAIGLYDAAELQRILMTGINGKVEMKNANDALSLILNSNYFNGGRILLNDDSGDTHIEINSKTGANSGGSILMNNIDLNRTIRIDAQDENDGGLINIFDDEGKDRISMHSGAPAFGGSLSLFNSSEHPTVEMNGGGNENAGTLFISGSKGAEKIKMFAAPQSGDNGGWISMFNDKDNRTLLFDADSNSDSGQIEVSDDQGGKRIGIYADQNETSPGGFISVLNTLGQRTIGLDGQNSFQGGVLEVNNSSSENRIKLTAESVLNGGANMAFYNDDNKRTLRLHSDSYNDGGSMTLYDQWENAKVRIIAAPIEGTFGSYISMFNGANERTVLINSADDDAAGIISLSDASGDQHIRLDANWNSTGYARVITDELELNGGSDFAEYFNLDTYSEETKGLLVSIDPLREGELIVSGKANDRMVVGVVSGANGIKPGMLMGQDGSIADGDVPIAIAGRVYVKVSDENGIIQPGDMLTSSSISGHAMKVTNLMESIGAIVGKALSTTDEKGYVLMLVNLL